MASPEELQDLRGQRNSTSVDESISKISGKHAKSRPSVDVQIAQNYRSRQDLPPIKHCIDPELHIGEVPSPDVEYVEILPDESLRIDPYEQVIEVEDSAPPRDYVTGRILSGHGRCLRCMEKGLRCTLNFISKEIESQCAACRRSKVRYCVRFQSLGENSRGIPFNGPLWKNPNFVAGTMKDSTAAHLPREELEDILREFYDGNAGYVLGNYVAERDVRNYALPPFNGVDLSRANRPNNYETMDWKEVLPDWKNRSLRPRRTEGGMEGEREKLKKKLATARDRSLLSVNSMREGVEELNRRNVSRMQAVGGGEDDISFLRALRRYEPRERNLSDCV
ncbi:hypothetical protein E0Z10_g7680 [Xylaria hypoxylon]|uniref:Uncharacterized protein n=1 Tax=Xylaria hypoxylon TaxID=37992 RepID=A0A4Z0YA55_9PEZI|nr:hypothetical protein E0Z10_g7680 [Xylaria hypoxylon]